MLNTLKHFSVLRGTMVMAHTSADTWQHVPTHTRCDFTRDDAIVDDDGLIIHQPFGAIQSYLMQFGVPINAKFGAKRIRFISVPIASIISDNGKTVEEHMVVNGQSRLKTYTVPKPFPAPKYSYSAGSWLVSDD